MRILAFYPYIPYPLDRGAFYRGFHLLRELARGHDVDLLALSENSEGVEHKIVFSEFCHRVEFAPFRHPNWARLIPNRLCNRLPATVAHWALPHLAQVLERMLATERYDAVHIFDIILAQYFLRSHCQIPLVVDRTRVDLQYQLMERRRMRFDWKTRLLNVENLLKLWMYERRVARRSRFQIVCGPDDAAFLDKYVSRALDVVVIPNGADPEYFQPGAGGEQSRSTHPTLVFCGAMDYNPNIDALRWYFSQIHDHLVTQVPDVRLWIVGKHPVPEVLAYSTKPNVTITGAVPDVRPYYQRAWLQIVPLRIGGGTRLKIVESMAMGTAVVSTTIGAQGLYLHHNRDILLADSPAEFVAQTARALTDLQLRRQVEHAGLHTVRSRLSWPMLGKRLSDVYSQQLRSLEAGASALPRDPAAATRQAPA